MNIDTHLALLLYFITKIHCEYRRKVTSYRLSISLNRELFNSILSTEFYAHVYCRSRHTHGRGHKCKQTEGKRPRAQPKRILGNNIKVVLKR